MVVVVLSDQPTPKVLVVPGVKVMRGKGKLGRGRKGADTFEWMHDDGG
jgi:hypothetical protein